jgi:CheY-like chemotaxis protein
MVNGLNLSTEYSASLGRRILLVDDDEDFIASLSPLLQSRGYEVRTATRPADASIEVKAVSRPIDVALVDLRLGTTNGLDLVADLRSYNPNLVCVLITAYATVDTAVAALSSDVSEYLRKPFSIDDLLAILDRCFLRVQLERDKRAAEEALQLANAEMEDRIALRTSELEAARLEAQEANLAKRVFLGQMSHQLRTPLNSILGFAQLLEANQLQRLESRQRDFVGRIRTAGEFLQSLVDDLLDLDSIESGALEFVLKTTDVQNVADQACAMYGFDSNTPNVLFRTSPVRKPVIALADTQRLSQALHQLVAFISTYTASDSEVSISVAQSQDKVTITVLDSGPQLSEHYLPQQSSVDSQPPRDPVWASASGLGLTVAKNLVALMRGNLEVFTSDGDNLFVITLEAGDSRDTRVEEVSSTEASQIQKPTENLRVLYVEDLPTNMALVREVLLKVSDVALLEATYARAGIDLAVQELPDVILMDIDLPDMTGFQALQALRKDSRTAHIPVIAVSGNATKGEIERGLAAGFADYITKPFAILEFAATVERVGYQNRT